MALPPQRRNLAINPSFEAGTVATYRTNLCPNPSFEANVTGVVGNYGTTGAGSVSRLTSGGATGSAHARMTWTTASTAIGGYMQVDAGTFGVGTYTVSCYVRVSTTAQRVQMSFSSAGGPVYAITSNPAVDLPVNGWTRVWATVNVTTGGALVARISAVSGGSGRVWAIGNTLDTDGWLSEVGTTVNTYFDGSTPLTDDGDIFYAWQGTTSNSASEMQTWQPTAGVYAGGLYPAHSSSTQVYLNGSAMHVLGQAADAAGSTFGGQTVTGLTVGATYTASIYVYVNPGSVAAELQISGLAAVASGKTTTTGQWERVYQTFVAATTSHDFRVRNAAAGAVNAYYDALLVEAGSTLDSYFDGAYEEAGWSNLWTGTPNGSQSTRDATGLWVDVSLDGTPHTQLTVLGLGMTQSVTKVVRSDGKETWPVPGWLGRRTIDADTGTDWTPPLGRPITYTLYKDGIAIASRVVTVDAVSGDIMDPANPPGALKVNTQETDPAVLTLGNESITKVKYQNIANEREYPLGARYPIARPGVRAAIQQVPFVFNAARNTTSDALQEIVSQAPIILIRTHPSWGNLPPLIYTDADVEEAPFNRGRGGEFTQWTMEADAVAPVTRAVNAGRITHDQVKANLFGRTHDSIRTASSSKRHVEIKANPLQLGS